MKTYKEVEYAPKNIDGVMIELTDVECEAQLQKTTTWNNTALTRSLSELRETRNNLLAKTDWTANSDVVMSDAMKTYRQQLRDATTGLDTVEKVQAYTFPEEVSK